MIIVVHMHIIRPFSISEVHAYACSHVLNFSFLFFFLSQNAGTTSSALATQRESEKLQLILKLCFMSCYHLDSEVIVENL